MDTRLASFLSQKPNSNLSLQQPGVRVRMQQAILQQFNLFDQLSHVYIRGKCPDQSYRVVVSGRAPEGEEDEGGRR